MNELLSKFRELKEIERKAKEQREDIEAQIYLLVQNDLPEDGSRSFNYDGYKLSITQNMSMGIDQEKAEFNKNLFKTKYEMTYSMYKKLDGRDKELVSDAVTIKPAKPTFKVEVVWI